MTDGTALCSTVMGPGSARRMKTLLNDVVLDALPDAMLHDMEIYRDYTSGLGQLAQIWLSRQSLATGAGRLQALDRNRDIESQGVWRL